MCSILHTNISNITVNFNFNCKNLKNHNIIQYKNSGGTFINWKLTLRCVKLLNLSSKKDNWSSNRWLFVLVVVKQPLQEHCSLQVDHYRQTFVHCKFVIIDEFIDEYRS